jgi:hypothetical protein
MHFYCPEMAGFGLRGSKKSGSAVVREGHRFETKVMSALAGCEQNGWVLLPEFCIRYKDGKQVWRKVYIDILAINVRQGRAVVLEMKRTHVAGSYEQIWKYMAMVKSWLGQYFAVSGAEVCLFQGTSLEYPGPHTWIVPGELRTAEWDGNGMPVISVVPWYAGKFRLV